MKKTFITLFLIGFLLSNADATNSLGTQVNNAKFQMIKSTVELLATDVNTFGKVKNVTCKCKSYEEIRKFATENKLSLVPELINELKAIEIDSGKNWEKDLQKLKSTIIKKITSGEKEKRKKLKGYDEYTKNLDKIISSIKSSENNEAEISNDITPPAINDVEDSDSDNASTNNENDIQPPVEESNAEPEPTDNLQTNKTINGNNNGEHSDSNTLLYIVIGLLASLCAGLFYKTMYDKKNYEQKLRSAKTDASTDNDKNKSRVIKLDGDLKKATEKIDELVQLLNTEKSKVEKLESEKHQTVEKPFVTQETKPSQQTVTLLAPKPENKIFYARYADLGDGFSTTDLLTEPDGETIFEINVTSPGQAKYRISKNAAAQKYALSNASYFLGKTCNYDIAPGNSTVIRTVTDGDLKLHGNKWTITNAVKISFS